jgi:hypothetical protein
MKQLREMGRAVERDSSRSAPSADRLRREALWSLIRSDTSTARNRAVALLNLALAHDPASPARRNDLAAALLVRGELDSRPIDWVDALELVDQDDGALLEARFNRALALQALTLHSPAREAWRSLAAARSRTDIASLAERWSRQPGSANDGSRPSQPDLLPLRRRGERELGRWGTAILAGDARRADAQLAAAAATAADHRRGAGDPLLEHAVGAIREASNDPARQRKLARGLDAYDRARGDGLYAECSPQLDSAERDLTAGNTPFAGWARLDQAICAYFRKDFRSGYQRLGAASEIARRGPYPALAGRIAWMVGLMRMLEGHFLEAEKSLATAAADFSAAREPGHVAYLEALISKTLDNEGDSATGWRHRMAALERRESMGHERVFTVFEGAVESLRARHRDRTALLFLDEQVEATRAGVGASADWADVLALTLLSRAALQRELGLGQRASADLAETEAIWRALPASAEIRERIGIELAVQRGALEHPRRAASLAAIDTAIVFFGGASEEGDWIEILRLLRLRAALDREQGDLAAAESDLRRSIAALERLRLALEASDQRARFLAHFRDTYEELVDLLIAGGRSDAALELVEETSNRWWQDALANSSRLRPSIPGSSRSEGPARLTIRYAHLRDRVLIWTLGAGRPVLTQRRIDAERAAVLVALCQQAIRSAGSRDDDASCGSAAELFLPAEVRRLPAGGELIVVTDDLTQPLPFAALRAAPGGPYLIERWRLRFAPSALLAANEEAAVGEGTALFVADPAFDRAAHPRLVRLPSARHDAARYADFYPAAAQLSGGEATRAAVLAALPAATVAHFSAHGYEDPSSAELGGLLLAPTSGRGSVRTDTISARDLAGASLPRLRVAVLAGCSTDARSLAGSNELAGLATALLAAGARDVVTTGWDVDDALASEMFGEFHRCHAAGHEAGICLRQAQLAFLQSPDPTHATTAAWAGYRLYGPIAR